MRKYHSMNEKILNQIARHMNVYETGYQELAGELRTALADLSGLKFEVLKVADAILDRIIPSAYTMRIDGDVSMRQRKRVIKD